MNTQLDRAGFFFSDVGRDFFSYSYLTSPGFVRIFFLLIFSLNCFCSSPSCNVNREKSTTSKYQLGFHPN